MQNNQKSILFTLSAVLLWSTVATAFKFTLQGMNNIQLLFYSSITSTVVLFLIILFNKSNEIKNLFSKKHIIYNSLLGFTNPFLYYLVLFKAYSLLPAQEAMPLNYFWPVTISLFASLFLGQKLLPKNILGMLVAFFGIIVISTKGNLLSLEFHNLYGVTLAFGSSFIWAAFWTLNLKDKRNEITKLFSAFFFGTIFITIYILIFDSIFLDNYSFLFGAVYIGLFEMSITFFLWLKGLQLSSNKSKTATLVYLSPFLSMIFIALVLGEDIKMYSIIGFVLILSGILIQHLIVKNGKIKFSLK